MSNLYRRPTIDAPYQLSYHLAKRVQRKGCFRNRTIRNNNCLWRPCLLTDQNGMSNLYRGPSIDASYQVCSFGGRFQRRLKCEKLTDDRRRTPSDVKSSHCLEVQHWAEPVSLTFHSALRKLNTEPSIGASHQISAHFGQAVSEKTFGNRPI